MYKKAIVIELKDCYALAMEEGGGIIRIKKKPGLSVGDSIYVLPEDLYQKETKASVVSFGAAGASQKRKKSSNIHTGLWMKVASAAAVVLLCIGIMAPQMRVKAYALTSFDGDISIQLELDDQYRIIRIFSPDKGAEEKLKALRGKHIREAGEELKALCGDGQILAGYAVLDERKKDAGLEKSIYSLFCGQPVVCLSGSAEEAASAKESGKSLGQYLLEKENEKEKEEETDREDIEGSEEFPEEETEKKEEEEKKPSTECENDAEEDEASEDGGESKDDAEDDASEDSSEDENDASEESAESKDEAGGDASEDSKESEDDAGSDSSGDSGGSGDDAGGDSSGDSGGSEDDAGGDSSGDSGGSEDDAGGDSSGDSGGSEDDAGDDSSDDSGGDEE